MKSFQPDTIIAIGGGSPMDAAKSYVVVMKISNCRFNDKGQKGEKGGSWIFAKRI